VNEVCICLLSRSLANKQRALSKNVCHAGLSDPRGAERAIKSLYLFSVICAGMINNTHNGQAPLSLSLSVVVSAGRSRVVNLTDHKINFVVVK